jgi:hypothetical protein
MLLDHAIATPTLGITATSRNMTGRLLIQKNDTLCAVRNGYAPYHSASNSFTAVHISELFCVISRLDFVQPI